MAELVQLPQRRKPDDEAAEWIARLDRGLAADETVQLRAWLRADSRHADALLELAALWDDLDLLAELSALLKMDAPREARRGRGGLLAASAAGVLIAAGAAGFFAYERGAFDGGAPAQSVALAVETQVGEQLTELLPDASVVTLNTSTSVAIEYSASAREAVLLRGEAYFAVADDPLRPFRVRAGSNVVQALGTAFNVKIATGGEIEVTVAEGRVKLLDTDPARATTRDPPGAGTFDTTLIEGETALLARAARDGGAVPRISRLEPGQLDMKLAWQRGMLIFEGEPLEAMLDEVERYTTTDFVIVDEELRGIRIGGYFRAGDVEGLLIALRESFEIEHERLDNEMIVLRAAP